MNESFSSSPERSPHPSGAPCSTPVDARAAPLLPALLQSIYQTLRQSGALLLLPLLLVLPVLDLCLIASDACSAEGLPTPLVPAALLPAPNEKVVAMAHARGVQIYECRARADQPASYDWTFVAPEATLLDPHGETIGQHYAGPTWEASADGSRITGSVRARADAPKAGAIPWLLLTATASGTAPRGRLSTVSSVQRINTEGGAAPRVLCHQGNAGATARVPYTADYYFLSEQ